jgi:molybdopterin-containing oxidoreductase family membrane subunit
MAHTNGHIEPITYAEASRELTEGRGRVGGAALLVVFGLIALAGAAALISKLLAGPLPYSAWGYAAATLGFLSSTFWAAPMVAFATRLAKGYWALPMRRVAEMGTLAGIVTVPLHLILLNQLPDFAHRKSVWFDWTLLPTWWRAPGFWDALMLMLLAFTGLAILYFSSRPDFAITLRRPAIRAWGRGWPGAQVQWNVLTQGLVILGAFYLMVYVFVHMYIVSDLAMSLVPGWKSAIYPPYHAVSGLQAGLATTMLVTWALRRWGRLERYIGLDVFWGAAKLLLGTSLLFFYFTWSEFLLYWYGRTPEEIFLLDLLMWGPYRPLFIASFCMNFVLPLVLLIWNPIRVSINGPVAVAAIVFVGNLIDRIRIYVASWSVAGPVGQHFELAPPPVYPGFADVLIVLGGISAVLFLYLAYLRIGPPIAIWEFKTGLLLKAEQPYMKTEVAVVAKPR